MLEIISRVVATEYHTKNARETSKLGEKVGKLLRPGDIIALYGDMGYGKTVFVKGLAKGLGVTDMITSPTYALVHEHEGRLKLYHFDMFNIHSYDSLYSTGFFDLSETDAVTVIEWSQNIDPFLQHAALKVQFEMSGAGERIITISGEKRFADIRC